MTASRNRRVARACRAAGMALATMSLALACSSGEDAGQGQGVDEATEGIVARSPGAAAAEPTAGSSAGSPRTSSVADAETALADTPAVQDAPLDELAGRLLGRAEQAMTQGRPEAVGELLGPLLARQAVPSRVLFVAGWAAYQLLRYEDAVALMSRALAQDPGLLANSRVLGFALHKLGDFARAADLFEAITVVAPEESRAWYGLGLAELSQGLYPAAEQHLRRALEQRPDYLKGRYALARLFEETHRPLLALPEVNAVLEAQPSHVEGLYLLSRVQGALGRRAEAQATVARWRLAYTVRERIGPLQQLVVSGQASPEVFLEMAAQYGLLQDHGQQRQALGDGLRRYPGNARLSLAMRAAQEAPR